MHTPLDFALAVRPGDQEAVAKGPDFGEARAFHPNQRPGGMMERAREYAGACTRNTPGALVIRIRRRFNPAAFARLDDPIAVAYVRVDRDLADQDQPHPRPGTSSTASPPEVIANVPENSASSGHGW